jgi:uncharacterized protein (DUF1800 family)
MGDENTLLDEAAARHLLRRTGFGALRDEVQEVLDKGETRGAAADRLLDFKPKAFKPAGKLFADMHRKWVKYLLKAKFPLQEKLVLFWHDHFATAFAKVNDTKLMASQIQLLHRECKGNFKNLVKLMNKNAALMEFLDTVRNFKDIPNENYARELQELFTLGVKDSAGNPNYDQVDIVQIARAFTGWSYLHGTAAFFDYHHDFEAEFPARGAKEIYGGRGNFSGPQNFGSGSAAGEGEPEIDTIIDIIFQHRDTDLKNTVARRTARRLCEYFAHPDPSLAFIDDVVAASGFDVNFEISGLLRAILVHDDFYLSGAPVPWGSAVTVSVKWPIDYLVGTLRMFGMKLKGGEQFVDGGSFTTALGHLTNMGQVLFDPPSVFGWGWETEWICSGTLLARYNFAVDVTSARGTGKTAFRPDTFFNLALTDPDAIVDEAASIIGIKDHLTNAEHAMLVDYLTSGGLVMSLDLGDYDTRNIKLHGLFALLLQSPAYQLH